MDVVVTVPKAVWVDWILEGDAAAEPDSGQEWGFYLAGRRPNIHPGERVYVAAHGLLRGWAPLVRVEVLGGNRFALVRRGGAVACTVEETINGFRGWQARWWNQSDELPFPDWRTRGVSAANREEREALAVFARKFPSPIPERYVLR